MKKLALILGIAAVSFSSCKKDLPEVGGTSAQKLANEWWVKLTDGTGADIYHIGYYKLATYNSASNSNEVWVDDLKEGYGFKVKANANFDNLTFAGATAANEYYNPARPTNFPQTVTITEGKVLQGAGHSKTGNVTDSIYMKVEFSDDPGTIYTVSGTARTKYLEDDY
jgi:hypothetical protein